MSDVTQTSGPMLAADGTPLKRSLNRALRRQKLRALMLIAPLLIFILVTFIAPIADMLFRSIENQIVSDTLPRTTSELADWDAESGELPGPEVFEALYKDMFVATERRRDARMTPPTPAMKPLMAKQAMRMPFPNQPWAASCTLMLARFMAPEPTCQ